MRWIEAVRGRRHGQRGLIQVEYGKRKDLLPVAALAVACLLTPPAGNAQQTQQPPAPALQQAPSQTTTERTTRAPRFLVFIDAAHGGTDIGARLSNQPGNQSLEKDYVLALSVRLRSTLNAHGIPVVTSREADLLVPAVNRADAANHANPSACITLHATASGSGIHLFTSSLTEVPMTRFLPWDTAQGAYAAQSQRLSSEIDTAMTHAEIPVMLGRTALQPLDSFTCPAVAVEIAPLSKGTEVTPLSDSEYQNRIIATLAAALEQWQKDWRQQP
jgi:N-acetylmuramoyl-L-alanine amidase